MTYGFGLLLREDAFGLWWEGRLLCIYLLDSVA